MSFNSSRTPQVPMAPQGDEIASFRSYLDAQKAVDYLSDKAFPVQNVTIVGSDLMMVERVTGRLTYSKVAMAGLASGAWLGLFIGLLFLLFIEDGGPAMISAVAVGAGFGLLFSVISYAMTRGKRDFTSATQIVASRYAVLSLSATAGQAAQLLREGGFLRNEVPLTRSFDESSAAASGSAPFAGAPGQPQVPVQQAPVPAAPVAPGGTPATPAPVPSQPHPNFVDADGRPKYGVRTEDLQQRVAPTDDAGAAAADASDGGGGAGAD